MFEVDITEGTILINGQAFDILLITSFTEDDVTTWEISAEVDGIYRYSSGRSFEEAIMGLTIPDTIPNA